MPESWFIHQRLNPQQTFADRVEKLGCKTFGELLGKQGIYYDLLEFEIKMINSDAQTIHIPVPTLIKAKMGCLIFDSMLSIPITKYRDNKFFKCFLCESASFYSGVCHSCWEGYMEEQYNWDVPDDYYTRRHNEMQVWNEGKQNIKDAIIERLGLHPDARWLGVILVNRNIYHINSVSYVAAIRSENA